MTGLHPEREIHHGDEWNRTIKAMPLAMYMDWVKSKRPGFQPPNNMRLQTWCKSWRIKARAAMS